MAGWKLDCLILSRGRKRRGAAVYRRIYMVPEKGLQKQILKGLLVLNMGVAQIQLLALNMGVSDLKLEFKVENMHILMFLSVLVAA